MSTRLTSECQKMLELVFWKGERKRWTDAYHDLGDVASEPALELVVAELVRVLPADPATGARPAAYVTKLGESAMMRGWY